MQDIFPYSKFCVESDRRPVFAVCLDKDNVDAALGGELLKLSDHGCGYTLPAIVRINGEVVYVQL